MAVAEIHRGDLPRQGFLVRQGVADIDLRFVVYTVWMSLATAVFKEMVGVETIVFVGSFNLTVVEPVVAMQVCSLVLLARRRALQRDILTPLLLCMALLVFINMARGMTYDTFSAIRSFRVQGAFALYLMMIAFAPRDQAMLRQIRDALIVFGLVLCVLVALRVALGPQLFMTTRFNPEDLVWINDGGRPLSADGALMIGAALMLAISRTIEGVKDRFSRAVWFAIPLLLVALVTSAQATATVSSLTGSAIVFALHPSLNRGSRILLVSAAAGFGLLGYMYINGAFGSASLDFLPEYFQRNLLRRSATIEVRQMIWSGLMKDYWRWDLVDQLIGIRNNDAPYIFIALRDGYYWWASIHSMYYGSLVFMGALGLVLYAVTVLTVVARGLARVSGPRWSWSQFGGAIPLGLSAAYLIFGISYEIRDEHTVLVLLAVIASRRLPRQETPAALRPGFAR